MQEKSPACSVIAGQTAYLRFVETRPMRDRVNTIRGCLSERASLVWESLYVCLAESWKVDPSHMGVGGVGGSSHWEGPPRLRSACYIDGTGSIARTVAGVWSLELND